MKLSVDESISHGFYQHCLVPLLVTGCDQHDIDDMQEAYQLTQSYQEEHQSKLTLMQNNILTSLLKGNPVFVRNTYPTPQPFQLLCNAIETHAMFHRTLRGPIWIFDWKHQTYVVSHMHNGLKLPDRNNPKNNGPQTMWIPVWNYWWSEEDSLFLELADARCQREYRISSEDEILKILNDQKQIYDVSCTNDEREQ